MAKREWDKELFKKYEHVASPSQLSDYLDCPRKWWFRRCLRLPEKKDQKKFIFGNVLHDLVQRWLEADDSGRAPDGRQVELYPDGWNEGLNPAETALVVKLFEKGVEVGMLRRLPGRKIEKEYTREVLPGICSIGALDITSPEGVEDQKSTKNADYIATQKDLASDPKMLSYAYEWLQDVEFDAETVKLRLNYFVKDPEKPVVKHVEVLVPSGDVLEFWEKTCIPAHQGMLDLKRAKIPETDWRSVAGPTSKNICKKFGGCPRAKICAGLQSVACHRAEMERLNMKGTPPKRPKPMSAFAKKKAAPASTPATIPPVKVPAPAPTTASAATVTENAPWAVEACGACKGKGINKAGNPCLACYHIRKRRGEATVDEFDTWHDDKGNLCWKIKGAELQVEEPDLEPELPVEEPEVEPEGKAPIVAEAEVKKPKPARITKPKITEAPAPQAEQPAPAPAAAASGLGDGGFRLFINALPLGAQFTDANDILLREGARMAEEFEVSSYYDLDAFKRRDMLAAAGHIIATELAGQDVVAIGGGQDLKSLVDALRGHAREIIQGIF